MLKRFGIARQIIQHARLEHEEAAVDPGFLLLHLFGELDDLVALKLQIAEAGGRLNRRYGGELSVRAVEIQQRIDALGDARSEEHTSELQSLMRISYAVFCLKIKIATITKCMYEMKTTNKMVYKLTYYKT